MPAFNPNTPIQNQVVDWADISNKPTIPNSQVPPDWNAVGGLSAIANKPTISTIGNTGKYSDLVDGPILAGTYSVMIAQGATGGLPAPSALLVGKYAKVTDLFGEKTDLVLCSASGSNYYWQPVRPFYTNTSPLSANQNMTAYALRTPSLLRLGGTLSANRVITFDTTAAWPGHQFEIAMDGALSLFSLTLAGLALGATLSLLTGGRKRLVFDGTAYQSV